MCPIQGQAEGPEAQGLTVCRSPEDVCVDWQSVVIEEVPTEAVGRYMTTNLVTVPKDTSVTELARMMVDAHIHRLFVVDAGFHPVGVITATDILAAVASLKDSPAPA
jgi:CBS domain-containing protein